MAAEPNRWAERRAQRAQKSTSLREVGPGLQDPCLAGLPALYSEGGWQEQKAWGQ